MKKLFSKVKATKGFTLVEMIVVMAIIGILVALLAPNVATLIKDAQDTANDAKAKNVMTTLAAYNTKHIKDGYAFQFTSASNKLKVGGASSDNAMFIKVTNSTLNTEIKKLWKADSTNETKLDYAGNATGYLPANVMAGQEIMYLYMTSEGNVLGVVYCDPSGRVKSAVTNLTLKDLGGTADTAVISGTVRDKTTSDGKAFS